MTTGIPDMVSSQNIVRTCNRTQQKFIIFIIQVNNSVFWSSMLREKGKKKETERVIPC